MVIPVPPPAQRDWSSVKPSLWSVYRDRLWEYYSRQYLNIDEATSIEDIEDFTSCFAQAKDLLGVKKDFPFVMFKELHTPLALSEDNEICVDIEESVKLGLLIKKADNGSSSPQFVVKNKDILICMMLHELAHFQKQHLQKKEYVHDWFLIAESIIFLTACYKKNVFFVIVLFALEFFSFHFHFFLTRLHEIEADKSALLHKNGEPFSLCCTIHLHSTGRLYFEECGGHVQSPEGKTCYVWFLLLFGMTLESLQPAPWLSPHPRVQDRILPGLLCRKFSLDEKESGAFNFEPYTRQLPLWLQEAFAKTLRSIRTLPIE